MHWIIHFILRYKAISSLFLTVFLSIWMLNANLTRQHEIARTLTVTVFFPFQFTLSQVQRIKNIFVDNEKLKEQNATLELKISKMKELGFENQRLRELVGIEKRFDYELLASRTMVREPSYKLRSIVLNRGLSSGVADYMPVISGKGVIGKVVQVMREISLVQLITDPSARTSVMISRNGIVGILKTVTGRDFVVKYREHTDVAIGDTLVTSGLGGIYPGGIKVGVVKKIEKGNEPLFKNVMIKPTTDFDHIDEVFVIMLEPQWSAFQSQLNTLEELAK